MDQITAEQISALIRDFKDKEDSKFSVVEVCRQEDFGSSVGQFQLTAHGKKYYLHLTDINVEEPNNFYVVLNSWVGGRRFLEMHKTKEERLTWKFSPRKRDGRNPARKEIFPRLVESEGGLAVKGCDVQIDIPQDAIGLNQFISNLLAIAYARQRVDDPQEHVRHGDADETGAVVGALGETVDVKPHHQGSGPYGAHAGGEGEEHHRLKKLVVEQPIRIGLPAESNGKDEHEFASGDRVDVKFDLPDGRAAVVEVKTNFGILPGVHQAIKYRALLEVERDEDIGSGRVDAILVAHQFDSEAHTLAKKYGVKLVELKA